MSTSVSSMIGFTAVFATSPVHCRCSADYWCICSVSIGTKTRRDSRSLSWREMWSVVAGGGSRTSSGVEDDAIVRRRSDEVLAGMEDWCS